MAATSITGRLVLALTAGGTALWLLAALLSGFVLQHELNESFDRGLRQTAQRLLPLALDSVQDLDQAPDDHDVHHFQFDHEEGLVYQLRRHDGPIVLRSDDAPAAPFEMGTSPGFTEADDYRIFTLTDPQTHLAIQVAEQLGHRRQAVLRSVLTLFLPLLLFIPLSIVGIWLATRRGLAPLTSLQAQIAARDSANLAPLEIEQLPRELTPIAGAMAGLIDRLRAAFEAERSFAANSAHELRTPIAGALAQTQRLIATSSDEATLTEARKIEATLRRLADLAERLIQLARADAGIAASTEAVELVPILRMVVADCASRAGAREIDLDIAPEAERLQVKIDVDALAIVLRNLVNNAISHSRLQTAIAIRWTADRRLTVRNAAAVVPPEELERLRHRFARGPTGAAGSGLGLAIVETILEQIGATLELRSPATGQADGFEAVVAFP